MESNAFYLERKPANDDGKFVQVIFNPVPSPSRSYSQLMSQVRKPKGKFPSKLHRFLRVMTETPNALHIQCFVDDKPRLCSYLTTRYFTFGLCYTDEVCHKITNSTRAVPVYLYECDYSVQDSYIENCGSKIVPVEEACIRAHFCRRKVTDSYTVSSGTVYFLYTVSNSLFTVEYLDPLSGGLEYSESSASELPASGPSTQEDSQDGAEEPDLTVPESPEGGSSGSSDGSDNDGETSDDETYTSSSKLEVPEAEGQQVCGPGQPDRSLENEGYRLMSSDLAIEGRDLRNSPSGHGDSVPDDGERSELRQGLERIEELFQRRERAHAEKVENLKRSLQAKGEEILELGRELKRSRASERRLESELEDLRRTLRQIGDHVRQQEVGTGRARSPFPRTGNVAETGEGSEDQTSPSSG